MENIIPPMTDPLGIYWEQPKLENILIDDTHAVMAEKDFHKLKEYSRSIPGGVYEGKMWKRKVPFEQKFLLAWYIDKNIPGKMAIEYREIILL